MPRRWRSWRTVAQVAAEPPLRDDGPRSYVSRIARVRMPLRERLVLLRRQAIAVTGIAVAVALVLFVVLVLTWMIYRDRYGFDSFVGYLRSMLF